MTRAQPALAPTALALICLLAGSNALAGLGPGADRRLWPQPLLHPHGDDTSGPSRPAGCDRGWLGVELQELSPELRRFFGATEDRGVLLARVQGDSPAERAGLAVGDVLVELGGAPVTGVASVLRALEGRDDGERVEAELIRRGLVEAVEVELRPLSADECGRLGARRGMGSRSWRLGEDLPPLGAPSFRGLELDDLELDWNTEAWEELVEDSLEEALEATRRQLDALEDLDLDELSERFQEELPRHLHALESHRLRGALDTEALEGRIEELERRLEALDQRLSAP